MATRMTIACRAPGPIGTAWRRTSSGELTTSTSGSSRCTSSAFQVPWSSRLSPAWSTTPPVPSASLCRRDLVPPRCTARMIRSPLSRHHAGEDGLPDQARARRDHHLGEAGTAIEQRVLAAAAGLLLAEREMHLHGEFGGRLRVAAQQEVVALCDARAPQRRAGVLVLDGDQLQGPGRPTGRCRSGACADIGRAVAHAQLEDAAGEAVLLDQRLGVAAEVGGHGRAVPLGQEALAEQHDDDHRAGEQRHAGQSELEEAEAADAGIDAGLGDEDVDRRAGEGQQRSGMGGEHQRHQKLRRVPLQPDGDDDDDGQQRRDRAVDADQRGEQRDEASSSGRGAGRGFPRPRRGSGAGRPRR